MIITGNNIHNKLDTEITTANASILDSGVDHDGARDEVIYIDFEVVELPVSLSIKLFNLLTNSVHLTTDEQEYCTINLTQAKTQTDPPMNWGNISSYSNIISECQNKYDDHWPLVLNEGLAIVPIATGYHIYYAAHNPVHRSGLNWKFGGAFIAYSDVSRSITMSDKVYLQNGIQINGVVEIDHNGLRAFPRSELNTYQFWEEVVPKEHHSRSVPGVRHDEWGIDDYFTFTNDLTELEKVLTIKSVDYWQNYQPFWSSVIVVEGSSPAISPDQVVDVTLKREKYFDHTVTFTTDSDGFITKVQLPDYDGNNLAKDAKITYHFQSLDYIKIIMTSTENVFFKNGKFLEEWLPSVEKTIVDTNQESWTVVYNEKGIMTVTPENRDLPISYQPTFLTSYCIENPLENVIPFNSVPRITPWYFTGKVPGDCICINSGKLYFYPEGQSVTDVKIVAFIK